MRHRSKRDRINAGVIDPAELKLVGMQDDSLVADVAIYDTLEPPTQTAEATEQALGKITLDFVGE
jgi:hypothetical protein